MIKSKKVRILLLVIVALIVLALGLLGYLYNQGSVEHYQPPKAETQPPEKQVMNDLSTLAQAVEAYYGANLNYPQRLEELQPDFISNLPAEPATGKAYVYETDGSSKYRVSVPDPKALNLTELYIENGKLSKR